LLLQSTSEGTSRAQGEACLPLDVAAIQEHCTAARGAAARKAIHPTAGLLMSSR